MPRDATPTGPRSEPPKPGRPDMSSSWLVRLAPLRAGLVGVVLVVLGLTADGFGVLLWVGLLAIAVGVAGAVLLRRHRSG